MFRNTFSEGFLAAAEPASGPVPGPGSQPGPRPGPAPLGLALGPQEPGEPGGARRSQEEPAGARRSQEEPGWARGGTSHREREGLQPKLLLFPKEVPWNPVRESTNH